MSVATQPLTSVIGHNNLTTRGARSWDGGRRLNWFATCFIMSYFLGVPIFVAVFVFSHVTSHISASRSGHGHSLYPFNVLDPLWRPNRVFARVHTSCTIGWLGVDLLDTKAFEASGARGGGGIAVTRLTS